MGGLGAAPVVALPLAVAARVGARGGVRVVPGLVRRGFLVFAEDAAAPDLLVVLVDGDVALRIGRGVPLLLPYQAIKF